MERYTLGLLNLVFQGQSIPYRYNIHETVSNFPQMQIARKLCQSMHRQHKYQLTFLNTHKITWLLLVYDSTGTHLRKPVSSMSPRYILVIHTQVTAPLTVILSQPVR